METETSYVPLLGIAFMVLTALIVFPVVNYFYKRKRIIPRLVFVTIPICILIIFGVVVGLLHDGFSFSSGFFIGIMVFILFLVVALLVWSTILNKQLKQRGFSNDGIKPKNDDP